MVTAHTAAQMRQAALLQRKGIAPAENALSMMLQQESNATVAELMTASQDVDTLYIQTQVDVHAKALDTLDNVLIPSADDADLKAELEATRGAGYAEASGRRSQQRVLGGPQRRARDLERARDVRLRGRVRDEPHVPRMQQHAARQRAAVEGG